MGALSPPASMRRLPQVLAITLAVVGVPTLAVSYLRSSGRVTSFLLLVLAATVLSLLVSGIGAALWARQAGEGDAVFDDFLLWGWWRRRRQEHQLESTARLLELEDGPTRQARFPAEQLGLNRRIWELERLATSLEDRHPGIRGHSRRVARHAVATAKKMHLSPRQIATIRTAAAIHDIGKIETPAEILNKEGRLTEEEFSVIRCHALAGARLVESLGNDELTEIVRHHHERVDGQGYPSGLAGDEIPVGARIIAVADTFDAVTTSRPYRESMRHREALDLLAAEAGAQLDPDAVQAFRSYYSGRQPVTIWALLLNGPRQLLLSLAGEFKFGGLAVAAKATAATVAAVAAGGVAAGSLQQQPNTAGRASAAAPPAAAVATPANPSAHGQKGQAGGSGGSSGSQPGGGLDANDQAPVSAHQHNGPAPVPVSNPGGGTPEASGQGGSPPTSPSPPGKGGGAPEGGASSESIVGNPGSRGPGSSVTGPVTSAAAHVVETVESTPASEIAVNAVEGAVPPKTPAASVASEAASGLGGK